MNGRRIALSTLLCACAAGCQYDTQCRVDSRVGSLGGFPMDATPPPSPPAQGSGARAPLESIPSPPSTMGTWCPPSVSPVSATDEEALRRRLGNQCEQADACRPVAYEAPA